MGETSDQVETISRLVQWRIENLPLYSARTSDPFQMGICWWTLSVANHARTTIKLSLAHSYRANHPIVSFVIRVIIYASGRRLILHPEVKNKLLKKWEDFVWVISDEPLLSNKFIIDLEFTNLKTTPSKTDDDDVYSGWISDDSVPLDNAVRDALCRMLKKGIATDVTINAADGKVPAHQAMLAVRSPVFCSMFSHDSKEKKLRTVDIPDMSVATCNAFLQYLYGNVDMDEFLAHRMPLLRVADKYDVSDLRESCEQSLTEDLDTNNVLERLQAAHLYKLSELKSVCMGYLIEFGRIYDLHEELTSFFGTADRELASEVCQKVLASFNGGPKVGFSWG